MNIVHGAKRPWRGAWLVLLGSVLVAVVAGYGISRLHDYAAERGKLKDLLAELETAEEWHEVDEATHRLADQLGMLESASEDAQTVHDAFERYDTAVEQQLALLEQGQIIQAREVSDQRVHPAFARLTSALAAAEQRHGTLAERANRQANLGTLLILLAAAITIGALAWRFERAESLAAERLAHQALHDGLTGLPNRILLRDRTGQAIQGADRELAPAALLLLDLDRFKEVNDTLGHHYGDQLLVQVGQRLQATLRQADTVARLGGDEFALLLPRIETAEGAMAVATKLQAAFAEPFVVEGLSLDVEASIGVAVYPDHGGDPDELLQHADIAMYTAKETHAGFALFDPGQNQHSPRRLTLLGELRRAIESQQLVLHYQPKVDAHTGRVLGVEALVRWQHPEHGLIPPAEFIPVAEHTGLIAPLTHYVLDAAMQQCRAWQQAGHELSVAVNVSARRPAGPCLPRRDRRRARPLGDPSAAAGDRNHRERHHDGPPTRL
jgi:diguanylate cyclase (GGDEF)-like protein